MATVDEVKVTGRKYRLWDAVNEIWKRVSYWTAASDVEFEDGLNLEDKISEKNEEVADINDEIDAIQQDYVQKAQLTFVLSGNDLYITKTY